MKNLFVLLFVALMLSTLVSNALDKFYAINILGTELYKEPTFSSEVLFKIEVGSEIEAIKIIDGKEKKIIGEGFALEGNWINTKINGYIGYVFSAETSDKKPEVILQRKEENKILLFGRKIDVKSHKEVRKIGGGKQADYKEEITTYEFCTYKWSSMDDCFDHCYTTKSLTLNEVYYQFISLYANIGSWTVVPKFVNRVGNTLNFNKEMGASTDLKIVIGEKGSFEISSNDCT